MEALLKALNSQSKITCSGWLAEAQIYDDFAQAKVKVVRGIYVSPHSLTSAERLTAFIAYEGAPCDGAFLPDEEFVGHPGVKASSLDVWLCWLQQKLLAIITYDAKFLTRMIPSSTQGAPQRGHRFWGRNEKRRAKGKETGVYIVRYEGLDEYIFILPPEVWKRISTLHINAGTGITPFISEAPPGVHPFAVHKTDYAEAVHRLFDASREGGKFYTNPTTGFTANGWRPHTTKDMTSLAPNLTAKNATFSMNTIIKLWKGLKVLGLTPKFNPVAPLIADFLLYVPEVGEDLLFEHKAGNLALSQNGTTGHIGFRAGDRGPFARARQWHVLIWQQQEERDEWLLIPRHLAPKVDTEAGSYAFSEEQMAKFRYTSLEELAEGIRKHALGAISKVHKVRQSLEHEDVRIGALIASTAASDEEFMAQLATLSEETDIVADLGTGGNTWDFYLDWLFNPVNKWCMEQGKHVMLPLDKGSPCGQAVVIRHSWTEDEKKAFAEDMTLPIKAFAKLEEHHYCVPLRLWDLSQQDMRTADYPFWIRPAYWTRPDLGQPCLIIGSTVPHHTLRASEDTPPYLLLPSEFTTLQDEVNLMRREENEHDGSKYVQADGVAVRRIPRPIFGKCDYLRLERGSEFMTRDVEYNLLGSLVKVEDGSLWALFDELLTGSKDDMAIKNTQTTRPNPRFKRAGYLTTMSKIFQADWDFGRECGAFSAES